MSLTEYSKTYVPIYPDIVEVTKKHEASHWREEEVTLTIDVEQWKTGRILNEEKDLILNILRLFTTSDVVVGQGYYEKLIPVIKNNEARNMLGSFANREAVHQRAYALLSDTLGMGEEFYLEFLAYAEMIEKYEFMVEDIGDSYRDFATYLAKQTMIEGVNLFASFAVLLNFDRIGKMPGMIDVVRWSQLDESIHIEGNSLLFKIFTEENPSIIDDDFKRSIYDTARELVRLEDAFIDKAFELGGVSNLDSEDVKQYIRYVTDFRLNQLGFKKNWNVVDNPLPWVDEIMQGAHGNFFERAIIYAKGTLKGTYEDGYAGYSVPLAP